MKLRIDGKIFIMDCIPKNILQIIAINFYLGIILTAPFIGITILIYLLFTPFYFISLLYTLWFIYDRDIYNHGGRRIEWFRNFFLWKHLCDYFPIKMIKTCDLPANKNYIIGFHPHGGLCFGIASCFACEGTNFKKLFPGITPTLTTLLFPFFIPLHREHILSYGLCAASKEGIEYLLTKQGTGNAVVIAVGGSKEAYETYPGTANLILKNRKGFVRLALKHGASLVPVFSFGENDVYHVIKKPFKNWGPILSKLQFPVCYGQCISFIKYGIYPLRRPITVVVGSPIDLEKIEEPTEEQVNATHQKYIDSLLDLVEQHKGKYAPDLQVKII